MPNEATSLRLDRDLILERAPDGGYAWRSTGRSDTPALPEVVKRAKVVLKGTRDDLAVIDHRIAGESNPAKQDLYLDKRKRRQDAERFLTDFLGWVAQTSV